MLSDISNLHQTSQASDTAEGDPEPQPKVIEANSSHDDIFDFFRLPRELRDQIDAEITTDLEIASGRDEGGEPIRIEVMVRDGPVQKVLHLCRQFKEEYSESTGRAKSSYSMTKETR